MAEKGSISDVTKKFARTHDLISTAHHEAGHTIYGLLKLIKIESVQVYTDEHNRISGYTHYNFFDSVDFDDKDISLFMINSEISIKYSGLIAEKYHYKTISGSDRFPMFLKDGSSDDTLAAAKLFRQHDIVSPGRKRYRYKKKLIEDTLKELQMYWESVVLVAHNLFQKKRLYFSDLKNLLIRKSEYKEFWKMQFKAIEHIYKSYDKLDEKDFKIILTERGLI